MKNSQEEDGERSRGEKSNTEVWQGLCFSSLREKKNNPHNTNVEEKC